MKKKFRTFRAISWEHMYANPENQIFIFILKYPIKRVRGSIHGILTNVTELRVHESLFTKVKTNSIMKKSNKKFYTKLVLDVSKKGQVWLTDIPFKAKIDAYKIKYKLDNE